MKDPVMTTAGNSYERSSITEWLKENNTDPVTNVIIRKKLIPNHSLRKLIEDAYTGLRKLITVPFKNEIRIHA